MTHLTACVTANSEPAIIYKARLICPNVKEYTPQQQWQAVKEIEAAKKSGGFSNLLGFIDDYGVMRDAARECEAQKRKIENE